MIVLIGGCGLGRLAEALEAAGEQVALVGEPRELERFEARLVYVDPVEAWQSLGLLAEELRKGVGGIHKRTGSEGSGGPSPYWEELFGRTRGLVGALRGWRGAIVWRRPRRPPPGAFGLGGIPRGLIEPIEALESLLQPGYLLDVQALWARHGIIEDGVLFGQGHGEAVIDERGRSRLDGRSAAEIEADALLSLAVGLNGQGVGKAGGVWRRGVAKVLAVDLDNTLIYGEIADPGFSRRNPAWCPLGEEPQGNAEGAYWMAPRGLHEALQIGRARGQLLALITRNDPGLVARCFRRRPARGEIYDRILAGLVLDFDDFLVVEAGFGPKSEGLLRIGERLGIHPEHIAFLDDNELEREEVRGRLPEVRVLDGPVEGFREQLLFGAGLTPAGVSGEAHLRQASYRSRLALKQAEEEGPAAWQRFLNELQIEVRVRRAEAGERSRIEELLARSHQLRLSGRGDLPDDTQEIWVTFCRDRLADHGLVGCFWFEGEAGRRGLVELAVSCRVLPHGIAGPLLLLARRIEPEVEVRRVETGRNAASRELLGCAAIPGHLHLFAPEIDSLVEQRRSRG